MIQSTTQSLRQPSVVFDFVIKFMFLTISLLDCSQMTLDDPFLCLDLCYISALLHEGLGFNRTSTLLVRVSCL